eukprot:Phypoly_transcript_09323.p1 GENE.Phypoly_transcript_09323~~Phypoly_transcript_09323.p1  ORF type:complete len:299 (+),score=32.45 Phypoly_transcript_09323:225-1121(+)
MEELSHQFTTVSKFMQELDHTSLESSSKEFQELVQTTILQLATIAAEISRLHVFSFNEELDDIQDDSIKYILTPYYQAELQLQVIDKERIDHLSSAKIYFAHFLQQCERLKLVHKDDLKVLHGDKTENPTDRRATLIARTKREKEIRIKMEELQKQMSHQATGGVVDEEVLRNNWITMIKYSLIKAVSQLESTERELKMLESVAQRPLDQQSLDSRGNKIPLNAPISAKPVAYTILPGGRRQELATQVFRPGFNMATVTPEQAFEAEVQAGRMVKGLPKKKNLSPTTNLKEVVLSFCC